MFKINYSNLIKILDDLIDRTNNKERLKLFIKKKEYYKSKLNNNE
jgi:hypothetical protein